MTQKDKDLLGTAIEYVESHYPPDCPYYIQFISLKLKELRKNNRITKK
jgi:hypothetical protein